MQSQLFVQYYHEFAVLQALTTGISIRYGITACNLLPSELVGGKDIVIKYIAEYVYHLSQA